MQQKSELASTLEEELEKAESKIKTYEEKGREVPPRLIRMKGRLEKQLDMLESQLAELQRAEPLPTFTDDPPATPPRESEKSEGESDGEGGAEGGEEDDDDERRCTLE